MLDAAAGLREKIILFNPLFDFPNQYQMLYLENGQTIGSVRFSYAGEYPYFGILKILFILFPSKNWWKRLRLRQKPTFFLCIIYCIGNKM